MDLGTLMNSTLKLGAESRTVKFRIDGRPLHALVPSDSIFFGIKDILFNREYELFPAFELTRPRQVVVDAGANAGLYSIIASVSAKQVIALEPDSQIFKTLSYNISSNHLTNVVLKQSALSRKKGSAGFYRRGNTQLGTIRTRRNVEPILVDTISLKELPDENTQAQGRQIDLLKLDIEGSEFDVIQSSDEKSLGRVQRIVAEIHTEHGDISNLTLKLTRSGFKYVIMKRPLKKIGQGRIQILADYKIKFLMKAVDLIMSLSRYSDWSSLLLFASRERADFPASELDRLKSSVKEASLT
ncbi:MAG TPA: FkbM family methyltransferase [Candidatus Angelobacter sp.]|nr:FkbM family methyltransferase [Candidatus Angelobacter sp.]